MLKINLGMLILLVITSLAGNANEVDCIYEPSIGSGIGDVKYSILSLDEFIKVNGKEWSLLRGQKKDSEKFLHKKYGSFYNYKKMDENIFKYLTEENISETKLPNAGGKFLRVVNKEYGKYDKNTMNPKEDIAIGEYQGDDFASHTHFYTKKEVGVGGATGVNDYLGGSTNPYGLGNVGGTRLTHGVAKSGGEETRSKNISVNAFVKVRLKCVKKSQYVKNLEKDVRNNRLMIEQLCKIIGSNCKSKLKI